MDYKEKLRLAKEALDSGSYDKKTIEYLFPELKESEDERIRKSLIGFLKTIASLKDGKTISNEDFDTEALLGWADWLEKQGNDSIDGSKILQRFAFYTYEDEPDILYLANVFVNEDYRNEGIGSKIIEITDTVASSMGCDSIRLQCTKGSDAERLYKDNGYNELTEKDHQTWLEKQVSSQLAMIQWKGNNLKEVIDFTGKDKNFEKWFKSFEEYEKYVDDHNGIFKLFNTDGSHYEVPIGSWIVKTPDGYNVASKAIFKQKQKWSEEDEEKRLDTIKYLEIFDAQGIHGDVVLPCITWLKSLKPQPKQEWSEEDEKERKRVVGLLEGWLSTFKETCYAEDCKCGIVWLESIKEKYAWKPTDEQMEALYTYIYNPQYFNSPDPRMELVESVYKDLKKLKEE